MFNMGRQFIDKSNIWILAATIFVECLPLASFSAPADDLYLRLKKSPTQDKTQLDQAHLETVDQSRIRQMNEEAELNRRKNEQADRQMQPLPTLTTEAEISNSKDSQGPSAEQPQNAGSSNTRSSNSAISTGYSPQSAVNPANPTVTYDPLPDEIEFPGEPLDPKKASKAPQKK
jgi:hypothetical protein